MTYLQPSKIYRILKKRKINYLYHANSVVTAASFLKEGKLLSRGEVERRRLSQTSQSSDWKDKKLRIWNHVFLDMYDLHRYGADTNIYGPVLFVFDVEILLSGFIKDLSITTSNPIHWKIGSSKKNYLFETPAEFENEYPFGQYPYSSMMMFNNKTGALSLKKYLKKIILDNPRLKIDGINLCDYAFGALRSAKRLGVFRDVEVTMVKRKCRSGCNCQKRFRKLFGRTEDHFGLNL